MPHEGIDHASRRNEKCITREENFHHDEKNQPREADNWNIFHNFAAKILTINF